jgi:phosphoadenosine phosphosulfate reductase
MKMRELLRWCLTGRYHSRDYKSSASAGVTQLVECNLAKVDVAGSNPVSRSNFPLDTVIQTCISEFGDSLVVLTSFQREGMVIIDMVMNVNHSIPVLTIDTGRLPAATLEMIATVEERYGITVERLCPDATEVATMVSSHGNDLFYEGVPHRMLCCNVRKVRPLARRMAGVSAYFTGIRRDQSDARGTVEAVDRSTSPVRISPLADWSAEDVAAYTRLHNLPEHPLYSFGYSSIGCEPCTRAVKPGESERAGRWWWETDADKECGIHFSPDGRAERTVDVLLREVLVKVNV